MDASTCVCASFKACILLLACSMAVVQGHSLSTRAPAVNLPVSSGVHVAAPDEPPAHTPSTAAMVQSTEFLSLDRRLLASSLQSQRTRATGLSTTTSWRARRRVYRRCKRRLYRVMRRRLRRRTRWRERWRARRLCRRLTRKTLFRRRRYRRILKAIKKTKRRTPRKVVRSTGLSPRPRSGFLEVQASAAASATAVTTAGTCTASEMATCLLGLVDVANDLVDFSCPKLPRLGVVAKAACKAFELGADLLGDHSKCPCGAEDQTITEEDRNLARLQLWWDFEEAKYIDKNGGSKEDDAVKNHMSKKFCRDFSNLLCHMGKCSEYHALKCGQSCWGTDQTYVHGVHCPKQRCLDIWNNC